MLLVVQWLPGKPIQAHANLNADSLISAFFLAQSLHYMRELRPRARLVAGSSGVDTHSLAAVGALLGVLAALPPGGGL